MEKTAVMMQAWEAYSMTITLDQILPGQRARVTKIGCDPDLQARLADFGLVPDTNVGCRYKSPDGTVLALMVRGALVAVRRQDLTLLTARLL